MYRLVIIVVALFAMACSSSDKERKKLVVFHAGSLSIPMKLIEEKYEKLNPDIDLVREASGSRKAARKISDLQRDCDLFLSADYKVIDHLLIPEFADHNIVFASNEMVLAYTDTTLDVNEENWHSILLQEGTSFGRTDPNLDPCGYRTLQLFQLAELYDQKEGLAGQLSSKDHQYIRGTEAELSALLKTGELDFVFLYKSVAEQHGLVYHQFPDSLNLSNPQLENFYARSSVELKGKEPGSVIYRTGQSITYGLCIPKASQKKDEVLELLSFILSEDQGLQVLQEQGQNVLQPTVFSPDQVLRDSLITKIF